MAFLPCLSTHGGDQIVRFQLSSGDLSIRDHTEFCFPIDLRLARRNDRKLTPQALESWRELPHLQLGAVY